MIYRHYRGGTYDFVGIAHVEKTLEPVVVYQNAEDGTMWTRPATEFFGDVEVAQPGDAPPLLVPRFVPVSNH